MLQRENEKFLISYVAEQLTLFGIDSDSISESEFEYYKIKYKLYLYKYHNIFIEDKEWFNYIGR